jgi:hypothetical protein
METNKPHLRANRCQKVEKKCRFIPHISTTALLFDLGLIVFWTCFQLRCKNYGVLGIYRKRGKMDRVLYQSGTKPSILSLGSMYMLAVS